jgi:hypothetical protein
MFALMQGCGQVVAADLAARAIHEDLKLVQLAEIFYACAIDALVNKAGYTLADICALAVAMLTRYPQRRGNRTNRTSFETFPRNDCVLAVGLRGLPLKEIRVTTAFCP